MQFSVLGCGVERFPWKKGGHSRLRLQACSGAPVFGSLCELPLGKSTLVLNLHPVPKLTG